MKPNLQAFKRLCELEGHWEGKSEDGSKQISLRYMVASNQSIVIEFYRHYFKDRTMQDEMVTVYHPNGDDLMLTHYCTLGNQPRMVADLSEADTESLRFGYVDATNLRHSECLRMSGLSFRFDGPDKLIQTWHWFGKKAYVDPNHHSDDYDDLPEDGRPGQDTFILNRTDHERLTL